MRRINVEELEVHKSYDDGWVLFNQKEVIDISKFKHPGGVSQLTSRFGQDITEAFHQVGHSEQALQIINGMKIGELVDQQGPIEMSEVAKHNTLSDGWVLFGNEVIDISNFHSKHPGGSSSFDEFLGGKKDMKEAYIDVDHSENADKQLKKYKIGELGTKVTREPEVQVMEGRINLNRGIWWQLLTLGLSRSEYLSFLKNPQDQDCVFFDNWFMENICSKTK